MVLTLSKKLLLAFIGLTIVVLLATLSLARWSFERGFLDYTNALEQQRLTRISGQLSELYLTQLETLQDEPQAVADQNQKKNWSKIATYRIESYLFEQRGPRRPQGFGRPPHREGHFEPQPPPPHVNKRPPPREPLNPSTALVTTGGQLIAGRLPEVDEQEWIRMPVELNNRTIGMLISASKRHFESPQETAFSKQQWVTSIVIGIVALGLALAVSLVLIRIFLAPIERMIQRVSQMSNGDYGTRLNESRKDELGQLMNDLDRLAVQLEQNQSARQRWLADISHELRTPVTVLAGELGAIQDGVRPLGMPQINSLDQEVTRLRRLIDDLYQLSLSDIGGLRYHFEPVIINHCLSACVDKIQAQALEKGLSLTFPSTELVYINADAQRLQQLFSNLLANALAYTDAPGHIFIALAANDGHVEVIIEDSPPGVTQEECDKLFEPLFRHEASRNRRTAGAGLGLSICRNIIDAHQGEITINPSKLGGIAVTLSFSALKEHKP